MKSYPLDAGALVYAVPDTRFGRVLNAQIELKTNVQIDENDLKIWLKLKLSRAEMPHHFSFEPIKILSTGKHSLLK